MRHGDSTRGFFNSNLFQLCVWSGKGLERKQLFNWKFPEALGTICDVRCIKEGTYVKHLLKTDRG